MREIVSEPMCLGSHSRTVLLRKAAGLVFIAELSSWRLHCHHEAHSTRAALNSSHRIKERSYKVNLVYDRDLIILVCLSKFSVSQSIQSILVNFVYLGKFIVS